MPDSAEKLPRPALATHQKPVIDQAQDKTTITPRQLKGQCTCGAVHYTVTDAFQYAMNCHCSGCRRTTGSAFKPLAGIKRDHLHITNGQHVVSIYGGEAAHDARCGKCSSLLYSVVRQGEYVHVAMGTLVDDPTIRPSMHIFVGSKASWHDITDDLPQFIKFPEAK